MKKIVLVMGLLLLVGIPVFAADLPAVPAPDLAVAAENAALIAPDASALPDNPVAPIAMASCFQEYQACLASCGGNSACQFTCRLRYDACRYY
jgi:hypothetical protein